MAPDCSAPGSAEKNGCVGGCTPGSYEEGTSGRQVVKCSAEAGEDAFWAGVWGAGASGDAGRRAGVRGKTCEAVDDIRCRGCPAGYHQSRWR